MASTPTPNVVHVIQLAVAPVFLLSGIGVVLTVLTGRLARIIDRARLLEDRLHEHSDARRAEMEIEMRRLSHRARMINMALTCGTSSALLVCLVIALLFLGSALKLDTEGVVAVMFVAAMACLVAALSIFLREIYLGTAQLRIGPPK